MKKFSLIGLLVILSALIIYSGPLFDKKLAISGTTNRFISSILGGSGNLEARIKSLESENRYLRELLGKNTANTDSIKVYSSYPFNSKGEIAIAAGEDLGLVPGDAIVVGGNILVGRVRSVFKSSSIVTTIFDPSWEVQARIGESEVDALMQGGNELRLILIPNDGYIEEGDLIISAGESLPYGLEIGFVGETVSMPGDVFNEAIIEPSLQIKKLRDVALYR